MKRAIAVLRASVWAYQEQARVERIEAERFVHPDSIARAEQYAVDADRHADELDAAIKHLEAAEAVRELVRLSLIERARCYALPELIYPHVGCGLCAGCHVAALLRDTTLRALIDEGAAGASTKEETDG